MNKEIYNHNGYAMLPYIYMQCFWFYNLSKKKNQQDLHIFVLVKSQEHRVKVKNKSINKIPPQWLVIESKNKLTKT